MEDKKKRKRSSSKGKRNGRYVSRKKRCRCRHRKLGMILVLLLLLFVVVLFMAAQYIDFGPGQTGTEANTNPPAVSTVQTDPTQPTEVTEPVIVHTIPQETITKDVMGAYTEVFIHYQRAVSEKWDIDRCEENQISYMVSFLDNLNRIGYYLVDLDGDTHPELIISDGQTIYDMYCLTTKGVQWVLSGAERNAWTLCEGNILKNIGSNGAASSLYDFYTWNGSMLVTERNVIFNGEMDAPWSTIYRNEQQVLTPEEADALIRSYTEIQIPKKNIP